MDSDIRIDKEELYNLIRVAIIDELKEIKEVSDEEQSELEKLHGKSPRETPIDFNDCVEL